MCSSWDLETVKRALTGADVKGKRVLEVGSLDVNGSVRAVNDGIGMAVWRALGTRSGGEIVGEY